MRKKITTQEFIERAKAVHGDRYDYSLTEYFGDKIKVNIMCNIHGFFNQDPRVHCLGSGCPKCCELKKSKLMKDKCNHNKDKSNVNKIELSRGKYAIVDPEYVELLNKFNWSLSYNRAGNEYAITNMNGIRVKMHRFIMGVTDPSILVDHKNRNGLDNRKHNLRLCDKLKNAANSKPINKTSAYKGVSFDNYSKKWVARIKFEGKQLNLGRYDDEEDAARAYDAKAKEVFGEFAYLNFK